MLTKTLYKNDEFFKQTSTVFTIHNLVYQGHFSKDILQTAGFSSDDFTMDKLEYYGGFNFMKTALVYSDAVSTVSPNYSREIQTKKDQKEGARYLRVCMTPKSTPPKRSNNHCKIIADHSLKTTTS